MSVSAEARAIADAQLVAYNAHDMDSYLALFHKDAVLVNLPNQEVVAEGIDAIGAVSYTHLTLPTIYSV